MAAFEGQEALSKEDKTAGSQAREVMQQVVSHVGRRLAVLRWRYAFGMVVLSEQDRKSLVQRSTGLKLSKADRLVLKVSPKLEPRRSSGQAAFGNAGSL